MEHKDIIPTPVVVILGETASGKSALSMDVAKLIDGEIIAADSRTVYRGLNIGTAKPSIVDRAEIPHFGLDIINPDMHFTAAEFQSLAKNAIGDISARGKVPMVVGGTGLYIDSLLFDYEFPPVPPRQVRERLSGMTLEQLNDEAKRLKIVAPGDIVRNPRYLQRFIEREQFGFGSKSELRQNTLIIGLRLDRQLLNERIHDRALSMVKNGLIDEVREASLRYGWNAPGLVAPAYKAMREFIMGHGVSIDESIQLLEKNDRYLAKRQRTWFKRNKSIRWISDPQAAESIIENFLSINL